MMRKTLNLYFLILILIGFVSQFGFANEPQTSSCHADEISNTATRPATTITAEFVRLGASTTIVPETKVTKTGQIFTRDTSNPKLGEAWRDPSGMIWGDIVKNKDGSARLMNQKDAIDYCKSIDLELPSSKDFVRLREYMGAKSGSNADYAPQILPKLTYTEDGAIFGHLFWSSSAYSPYNSLYAYYFDGYSGSVDYGFRRFGDYSARCVAPCANVM